VTIYSGFVEEGRKRKANFFNGAWQDSIYMGLLEEEWFERSKAEDAAKATTS